IEPNQPNAYVHLGQISLQDGDGIGFVSQYLKAIRVDPKDHELPAMLASFLYRLKLVEIGDDFRKRVLTLAPTSEVAYQLELLRAVETGDEEASIASARRAIEDDIEERHGSYTSAVQYLLRHAAGQGNVDEELAWIDQHAPGIFDIDAAQVPRKYRLAQAPAFDAWYTVLPRDELLRRIDAMVGFLESIGYDITEGAYTYVNVLAMRGETDEAIDVALERIFTRPVAKNLGWQEMFATRQFVEFVADPRIQVAMQRWEDEESRLRSQVEAFFEDMQAETPTAQDNLSAKDVLDGLGQRTVSG
ncbi:MAG: hypothetical protein KJN77_07015, partial [Gammaproteobacteria bacterium]|nr:hypothetical protein [Gammaproteobacteria bacterium]